MRPTTDHPLTLADRLADPLPNPEEALLAAERVTLLHRAIDSLPVSEARLLRAHYGIDGCPLTIVQLAEREGETLAQVNYRLRLARAHLKALLI